MPLLAFADTGANDWFIDDLESRVSRVNDGELVFLASAPPGVHEHHNVYTIGAGSLDDGWISLEQCHRNLDAVPRAQVLFNGERTSGLEITRTENIARAWVEGPSVQLEGVKPGAELCIQARSRALWPDGQGAYALRNGPFMRRFLDGYYPMVVSMEVRYPCGLLELAAVDPPRQEGFAVDGGRCRVALEAAFEGRLETELRFLKGQ